MIKLSQRRKLAWKKRKFLRSVLRFLRCRPRHPVVDDDSASPVSSTDDEELSRPSDEQTTVAETNDDQSEIKMLFSWKERVYRLVRKLRNGGSEQTKRLLANDSAASSHSYAEQDEIRSSFFSISTERKVLTDAGKERKEPLSLKNFMEKDEVLPKSIHLGDLTTQDSMMSVESAFLAVSFDDDYPQLVLQPSNEYSQPGAPQGESLLGVTYPHPARRSARNIRKSPTYLMSPTSPQVASTVTMLSPATGKSPTSVMSPATPPWLDGRKNDDVWNCIDGNSSNSMLSPIQDVHDRPAPTKIKYQQAEWDELEEEDMRWSFDDSSALSFSSAALGLLKQEDRPYDEF